MKKTLTKVSSKMENVNEVLEQFRSGSENALAYYHKKHFAALLNFTVSIVKQDDIAKDIVSNSFFKLWKNREKIDKPNNLTAYLYTSAKNECFTFLDKLKRENKHLENYKHSIDQFDEAQIRDFQRKSIIHERIMQEIDQLPNRCRLIMQCTFYKGMSNQDIAKSLNISVNTIKNQKTKGVKILRLKLKELYDTILKIQHSNTLVEKAPSFRPYANSSKAKWSSSVPTATMENNPTPTYNHADNVYV